MQSITLPGERVELTVYPTGDDVLVNVNVDGICVHQIRLQNIGKADFDALKANAMVVPHLVPLGDEEAFKRHLVAVAESEGSWISSG